MNLPDQILTKTTSDRPGALYTGTNILIRRIDGKDSRLYIAPNGSPFEYHACVWPYEDSVEVSRALVAIFKDPNSEFHGIDLADYGYQEVDLGKRNIIRYLLNPDQTRALTFEMKLPPTAQIL